MVFAVGGGAVVPVVPVVPVARWMVDGGWSSKQEIPPPSSLLGPGTGIEVLKKALLKKVQCTSEILLLVGFRATVVLQKY